MARCSPASSSSWNAAKSPLSCRLSSHRPASGRGGFGLTGRVRLLEIPGIEAAVAVHDGPAEDIDRTYGALGIVVAERAIGVEGPIREYYPDGFDAAEPHRTEICWPVFRTARA